MSTQSSLTSGSSRPSIESETSQALDRNGVVFVSIGHAGQINPLLAIAEIFHKQHPDVPVTIATSRDLEGTIKQAGFDFAGIWKSSKFPKEMVDHFNVSGLRDVEAMRQYTVWTRGEENYDVATRDMTTWMQEHKPALVVCDVLSEAGMAAAMKTKTPYIINSPLPPYTCFPECLPPIFPPVGTGTSYKSSEKTFSQRLYDLATGLRYGLGLVRHVAPLLQDQHVSRGIPQPEDFARGSLTFLNDTSKKLSHPRVRWPSQDRLQWIGACLREEHARLAEPKHYQAAWEASRSTKDGKEFCNWVDKATASSTRPTILVALGTLYQLDAPRVEAIYEALSCLPINVVWKLREEEQKMLPKGALSNPHFLIQAWIPDLLLTMAHPGIKLFINHAGGNSLHEGLFFGKPMVCLPGWMDCFDFAMRCQDAGAGLTIDTSPHLNSRQLHAAVRRVLLSAEAPTFAARAQDVGRDLRALGGAHEASRLVWNYLQPQSSQLSSSA